MKKSYFVAISGITIVALTVMLSRGGSAQQPVPEHPAATIGAGTVDLTSANFLNGWNMVMRGFVETGSPSEKCLVTFREATNAWIIQSVFCGHRVVNGRDGVLVTVFFADPGAAYEDTVELTVYQEHARYYAAPVEYTGD
jgi:hypothetical protein